MEEALMRAGEHGLIVASNNTLDALIQVAGADAPASAFWSGTLAAYDKPDRKLGKTIEYTDLETGVRYVFPVPEEHQAKTNALLVAEHPNFTLIADGSNRIVQAREVGIVQNFPASKTGWFAPDPLYGIPQGANVDEFPAGRFLLRRQNRVGLIARVYGLGCNASVVGLDVTPSKCLGVHVKISDGLKIACRDLISCHEDAVLGIPSMLIPEIQLIIQMQELCFS